MKRGQSNRGTIREGRCRQPNDSGLPSVCAHLAHLAPERETAMTTTVADQFIEVLYQSGVDHIYGLVGDSPA